MSMNTPANLVPQPALAVSRTSAMVSMCAAGSGSGSNSGSSDTSEEALRVDVALTVGAAAAAAGALMMEALSFMCADSAIFASTASRIFRRVTFFAPAFFIASSMR